jgi:hypothetical protein
VTGFALVERLYSQVRRGAPGRIRTCAPASGGRECCAQEPPTSDFDNITTIHSSRSSLVSPVFHAMDHAMRCRAVPALRDNDWAPARSPSAHREVGLWGRLPRAAQL